MKKTSDTSGEEHQPYDAAALPGRGQDRIVLEGLRGEDSIAELCRRQGIAQNIFTAGRKRSIAAAFHPAAG